MGTVPPRVLLGLLLWAVSLLGKLLLFPTVVKLVICNSSVIEWVISAAFTDIGSAKIARD